MKFRLHVLSVPHTRTTKDYSMCAFTQKAYKFCKMMTERGHYVIHYGVEGSNPICSENVVVVPNEIYNKCYGDYDLKNKTQLLRYNQGDECYQTFCINAIKEIEKRKKPLDIILPFWNWGVKSVCDAFPDLICIDPSIGHANGSWLDYKIYESYAIYHAHQDLETIRYCHPMNNYEQVIHAFFDLDDFETNFNKESRLNSDDPYFLYVGRIYNGKGVNIAIQVCEHLGVKLKIAGQLGEEYQNYPWNDKIEYVGGVGIKERTELMKNAIASFIPSQYIEPFGWVQVENLLCGTPIITPDWGAFTEINLDGLTGYRCKTFDDYVNAALNCLEGKIDYTFCRKYAENFSFDNIAPKYEKFFEDVINLYINNGWYTIKEETSKRVANFKTKLNIIR